MKIWQFVIKEVLYRKTSFLLTALCAAVAVGAFACAASLLKINDIKAGSILAEKQQQTQKQMAILNDDMRKATLRLGFNLAILPKEQDIGDWYADDFGSTYMPYEYVEKLANSGIISIRHLLPVLQQKITWPEYKRKIILVGTHGEVPNLHKNKKVPLVQPVQTGQIVLGYELSQSLELNVGDKVKLMGEEFTVSKCYTERGNKDDITAWIPLDKAQQMLNKTGKINAIIALQCLCVKGDLSVVRKEVTSALPDTKAIELSKEKVLARLETRTKAAHSARLTLENQKQTMLNLSKQREKFASTFVIIIISTAGLWIWFLAFSNVSQRKEEIGILNAIGFKSSQILLLFVSRAFLTGVLGGIIGLTAGIWFGKYFALKADIASANKLFGEYFDCKTAIITFVLAVALSLIASWLPAISACRHDPAEVLNKG